MAPSYIAALAAIAVQVQSLVGWNFASEQWTAAITIIAAAFIAIRQVITGRSNLAGVRPDDYAG